MSTLTSHKCSTSQAKIGRVNKEVGSTVSGGSSCDSSPSFLEVVSKKRKNAGGGSGSGWSTSFNNWGSGSGSGWQPNSWKTDWEFHDFTTDDEDILDLEMIKLILGPLKRFWMPRQNKQKLRRNRASRSEFKMESFQAPKSDYEELREARISENQARLASIGLSNTLSELRAFRKPQARKWCKIDYSSKQPLRRSARLSGDPPPSQEELNEPPLLPTYPHMIMKAIDALKHTDGANKSSISHYLESEYSEMLPAGHADLLSDHLNQMEDSGELLFVDNNYLKPKRGRGRPSKPKEPLPAGTIPAPPRPRGRPRKDSNAPTRIQEAKARGSLCYLNEV